MQLQPLYITYTYASERRKAREKLHVCVWSPLIILIAQSLRLRKLPKENRERDREREGGGEGGREEEQIARSPEYAVRLIRR